MNEIYVVIDSNGYVESYCKFESARNDVVEALTDYARMYCFGYDDLENAIAEFDKDREAGRISCGAYLGDYEVRCVKSTIIED